MGEVMRQQTSGLASFCARPRSAAPARHSSASIRRSPRKDPVALIQEECALDQDPMLPDTFVVDMSLTMRVDNGAPAPVKLDPDSARLAWNGGREATADDHAEELGVGAGTKKDLQVHFLVKGKDVACNDAMSLALDKAMELGGKPLPLPPISFQPSTTPDP